ncbi:DUF2550 family protein [Arcanobacterium buesumense]|uniref:DUF2550 family protein n=1 Tax=Arcanobacterium buesumense TaxID=2722751 RepID=A0A6H2EIH8_9ACTO|nr:DUF2550 family protein [Arcanobacterium buesumense]QJC21375.1 DUF2550 family protein [Arcanobacterium buesumense]
MIPGFLWWSLVIVASVIIVVGIYALIRLRILFSRSGSFHVALREPGQDRWQTGVAVFKPFELAWYSTRSLRPGPNVVWRRGELDFAVEPASGDEIQVVRITRAQRTWTLATTPSAVSGIVSWIDSAPPVEEPELF